MKDVARLTPPQQAGTPRTKVDTRINLEGQLSKALSGAPSSVDKMATASGTKDKYLHYFVEKIQETMKQLRGHMKGETLPAGVSRTALIQQALARLRREMPDNVFNPTLMIPGEFKS